MKKLSLKLKLVFSFLLAGLIPMLMLGIYSYVKSSDALEKAAINKLTAVRKIKGSSINRYFKSIKDQVLTFSHDVMIKDAMKSFSDSFRSFSRENSFSTSSNIKFINNLHSFYKNEFGRKYKKENGKDINAVDFLKSLNSNERALQYYYISSNENPLGNKEKLNYALDKSSYSKWHKKYHPAIREYLQKFGYYDIFLVDIKSGKVVYSVFKEIDFATSLIDGAFNQTNFAQAFKQAKEIEDRESFVLVDYKKYTPSYEAPASFIASPIWDQGKKVGVAVFQMPIDRLNSIMSFRSGMGKTGETYLFGQDRLMRSDSYLDQTNYNVISSYKNPNNGSLKGVPVQEAIEGREGVRVTQNYLGNEVISSYGPIDILGLKWGLIAEISSDEAFSSVKTLERALIIIGALSGLVILIFSLLLSTRLSETIKSIAKRVMENADQVANSSQSITKISTELSEASSLSASSLQQTVSSIDEIIPIT